MLLPRRISLPALLFVALAASWGCDGPPGVDSEGPGSGGGGRGLGPPVDAAPMLAPGDEIAVTLDVQLEGKARGTVSFLGVKKEQVDGSWMRGGQRPLFFWVSGEVDLHSPVALVAPLPEGLTYFAVVNQDADPLPGEGDLTSGPVTYVSGGALNVVVDARFGEQPVGDPTDAGARPPGSPGQPGSPPPVGGGTNEQGFQTRVVKVEVPAARRPRGPTVLMLIGREPERPGRPDADRADFVWRSAEITPTTWPYETELKLPRGMSVRLVLDADGDRKPSVGDPASAPDDDVAAAPADAAVTFTLDQIFSAEDYQPSGAGGDADPGGGGADAPGAVGGEPRTLKISTEVRLPFIRTGRFMVVGLAPADPFVWPPATQPTFLWVSDPTRLDWPVTLEAKVPDGLDLFVALDLDGSGFPDTGDLASKPAASYVRGAADAPVPIELEEVIPIPSDG
jgi:hypothetical protein